jgi:hypothetical protein
MLEQDIQQRAQGTTVSRTVCPKQATFYAFRMKGDFQCFLGLGNMIHAVSWHSEDCHME